MPSHDEYLCAVNFVNTYRDIPNDCMDDAVLSSFRLSTHIIEKYERMQAEPKLEQPKAQPAQAEAKPLEAAAGPWFMHGPKSELLAKRIGNCLQCGNWYELNEIKDQISEYQGINLHAYKRFISIYNYLTRSKA